MKLCRLFPRSDRATGSPLTKPHDALCTKKYNIKSNHVGIFRLQILWHLHKPENPSHLIHPLGRRLSARLAFACVEWLSRTRHDDGSTQRSLDRWNWKRCHVHGLYVGKWKVKAERTHFVSGNTSARTCSWSPAWLDWFYQTRKYVICRYVEKLLYSSKSNCRPDKWWYFPTWVFSGQNHRTQVEQIKWL